MNYYDKTATKYFMLFSVVYWQILRFAADSPLQAKLSTLLKCNCDFSIRQTITSSVALCNTG